MQKKIITLALMVAILPYGVWFYTTVCSFIIHSMHIALKALFDPTQSEELYNVNIFYGYITCIWNYVFIIQHSRFGVWTQRVSLQLKINFEHKR